MGASPSVLGAVADSAAWLARASGAMPRLAGAALVLVGLIVAVLGSRQPVVRVVALVAGAVLGFALAALPASYFHLPLESVQYALAGGLALLGAVFPEAIVFVVVGGPIGFLGAGFFPAGDRLVAFLPGFLVGGVVGAVLAPWVTAVLTAFLGGLAFAAGLARTLPPAVGGAWLLGHPFALAGLGVAIGIAGLVTQLNLPDEAERVAADAEHARKQ